jgi:hypothetical protein
MRMRRQHLLAFVVVGVCAVAVASCGSSADQPTGASSSRAQLTLSECMRTHGVPAFPDPSGGNINIAGTGINPSSPAFEAAQVACKKLWASSLPTMMPASEQQKQHLFAISQCMRRGGVSGFPDPTTGVAAPTNSQGYSIDIAIGSGSGAIELLVPHTINTNSPAFEQAAKACHLS